ncbi:hypothetical protein [Brochothrix thermosphacta]|nr:hypothetical protein [Brochothrix thermosphacta]
MNIEEMNKNIQSYETKKLECQCGKTHHREVANYCSNCGAKLLTRKGER